MRQSTAESPDHFRESATPRARRADAVPREPRRSAPAAGKSTTPADRRLSQHRKSRIPSDTTRIAKSTATATSTVAGLFTDDTLTIRCAWCQATTNYRSRYHDTESGFPVSDERRLFEKICLECFQAGLSWLTILNRRENFREAFANFEAGPVAGFDEGDVKRLLLDAGIVRHAGKIDSTINNAKRVIELRREFGSLGAYVWKREPDAASRPLLITHRWRKPCRLHFTGISRLIERPREARLNARWPHDDVRRHAGDGTGERPPRRL